MKKFSIVFLLFMLLSAYTSASYKIYLIPNAQIGIIAGYKGTKQGYNLLLKGDNDGIIANENTNLPDEVDINFVKASNWALTQTKKVIEMTLNFLKNGRLNIDDNSE